MSLLYTLWEVGFAVHRGSLLLSSGQVMYRPAFADRVLVLAFVWVPLAFLRQTIAASRRERDQDLSGFLNLTGLRHLWRPQGQAARAVRSLALVFLLPVVLSLVNLYRATHQISPAVFQPSMSAGILLTQFWFALVYLNSAPEMTTFQVRLVGLTLVMVLAVFGAAGWVMAPPHVAEYQLALADQQTLRFTPNAGGGYDVTQAPFQFDADLGSALGIDMRQPDTGGTAPEYGTDIAFTFPFYGQTRRTLWVMNSGLVSMDAPLFYPSMEFRYATTPAIFPLFTALKPSPDGGVFARNDGERLTLTWSWMEADRTPQALFTFQLVLHRDGVFEITTNGLANLPYDPNQRPFNSVWVRGASPGLRGRPPQQVRFGDAPLQGGPLGLVQDHYLEFRSHLHQLLLPLAYLILVSSVLVVVAFPIAFSVILVRPLNRLLAGVRQVDAGNLDISMPIQAQDEIGFLTQAFNSMIAALRSSITTLEDEVSRRTQQLERQNTELAQAKALAEERSQAAEAANQAKSLFLANMSHELRTPLNAVLGFSELMAHDHNLTADQLHNLERINRSGEHLLGIINDVLHLSRIEARRIELQTEELNLHLFLVGLEDMFRLRAEQKGLYLSVECAADVPRTIRADGGKLRQVLINLLGNAVKFTTLGGITLRVHPHPSLASTLHFEVQDTGIGISPDEIGTIFDPFVQTASGRQSGEGSGLGLSISRGLVRAMGGELMGDSAGVPGQGSLFAFDLPVEIVDAESVQATQPARRAVALEPGQPAYRLLVADDKQASRELLVKFLQPLGFELREAANGQEALDIWQEWQPHLIWMDKRMPVVSGDEAARRIKATPQGQETVIVALTASVFEENRAVILAGGFDDLLHKPVHPDEIVAALVRHLGVRFVYKELSAEPSAAERPAPGMLDLTGLPTAWIAALRKATIEADPAPISALVQEIRDQRPAASLALTEALARFDYGAILDAVRRCQG